MRTDQARVPYATSEITSPSIMGIGPAVLRRALYKAMMVEDLASLSETAEEDRRLQVWISGELHGPL